MRTFTALALATAMLFSVAGANATTHHKKKHHASSSSSKKKETAPKAETKAPEKK
jgi:hypothetical protein